MSDTRSQCRSMSSAGKSTSVKARARAVFGQSHSLKTMKELKYLSDTGANASMDKRERLTRTKACLVQLGDDIVAAGIVADTPAALELWRFIADKCHTGLAGERLQNLYAKLTVSFPRDGSRGMRSATLPRPCQPSRRPLLLATAPVGSLSKGRLLGLHPHPDRPPPAVLLCPASGVGLDLVPTRPPARQRQTLTVRSRRAPVTHHPPMWTCHRQPSARRWSARRTTGSWSVKRRRT
eukprot:TRINITY_DN4669_c0_g1_i5.p1 TRINITY_DN4669_c0_g1~~TRINITY_DN4669_c0_g1_i5.p1  ORF type:complete len:237 (+),score=20.35 TRINITY_DN4669_c0_g1_i5:541-1251(+)